MLYVAASNSGGSCSGFGADQSGGGGGKGTVILLRALLDQVSPNDWAPMY